MEACLSFPGVVGRTIRPQKVIIKAMNERGETVILTGEDEMAKCFCHEIDHLNGEVFIDKALELGEEPIWGMRTGEKHIFKSCP